MANNKKVMSKNKRKVQFNSFDDVFVSLLKK